MPTHRLRLPTVSPRRAVDLWTAGFAGAAAAQALQHRQIGSRSRWGTSGWQSEIVIWNLGTITTVRLLRQHPDCPDTALVAGFTALSAAFAGNHARALGSGHLGGGGRTHAEALVVNLLAVILGVSVLGRSRRRAAPRG